MLLAGEPPAVRVRLMVASEGLWAGLIEAEGACVAAFLESGSKL